MVGDADGPGTGRGLRPTRPDEPHPRGGRSVTDFTPGGPSERGDGVGVRVPSPRLCVAPLTPSAPVDVGDDCQISEVMDGSVVGGPILVSGRTSGMGWVRNKTRFDLT